MKKGLMAFGFMAVSLIAGQAWSAPAVVLDDINLIAGQISVDINMYIQTDSSNPVDSVAFDFIPVTGFDLTGVTINAPAGWVPTVNLGMHKFGATDFGWPANPIVDANYFYATMHYSFASSFFDTIPSVQIAFQSYELGDPDAVIYPSVPLSGGLVAAAPVPVPAAVWLLGSGLLGLVGLRRKNSKECSIE